MSNDQSSYAEAVKHLGLVRGRGQQGDPQAHPGPLQRAGAANPCLPRSGRRISKPQSEQGPGLLGKIGLRPMIETPLGVADRLNAKFAKAFKVVAEKASESDSQRGRRLGLGWHWLTHRNSSKRFRSRLRAIQGAGG
ncbi:hypothetical protein AGG97_34710 [Klebsiella michiganensis]|nr:hypothetical protein AGG97_34710 [Klebsiella michiganensis]